MSNTNKTINLNDLFEKNEYVEVTFKKPFNGNIFPIGKTESGITCFIQPKTKGYWAYESKWNCRIVDVKESCLIIVPSKEIKSTIIHKSTLADFMKQTPKRKEKTKYNYQFQSKNG